MAFPESFYTVIRIDFCNAVLQRIINRDEADRGRRIVSLVTAVQVQHVYVRDMITRLQQGTPALQDIARHFSYFRRSDRSLVINIRYLDTKQEFITKYIIHSMPRNQTSRSFPENPDLRRGR
jgi:hypothetical protein